MYAPHPVQYSNPAYGMNILFVRTRESKLFAFYVPTIGGVTMLPLDKHWWSDVKCVHFYPNFESAEIACMDTPPESEYVKNHRWSLNGKNLTHNAKDLEPVRGSEENGVFILYKTPRN